MVSSLRGLRLCGDRLRTASRVVLQCEANRSRIRSTYSSRRNRYQASRLSSQNRADQVNPTFVKVPRWIHEILRDQFNGRCSSRELSRGKRMTFSPCADWGPLWQASETLLEGL